MLEFFVLFNFKLSLLLLRLELIQEFLLLRCLLFLELVKSLSLTVGFSKRLVFTLKGFSLIVGLFGSFLKSLLHGSELLDFAGISWFLNSLYGDNESSVGLDIHSRLSLKMSIRSWWVILFLLC